MPALGWIRSGCRGVKAWGGGDRVAVVWCGVSGCRGGEEEIELPWSVGLPWCGVEAWCWEGVGRRAATMDKFFGSGWMDQCRFSNSTDSK